MARLFTRHTPWERLITIGLLGMIALALGDLTAAALGVLACLARVTTLGVETIRTSGSSPSAPATAPQAQVAHNGCRLKA